MEHVLHVLAGSKAKIQNVYLEIVKVTNSSWLQESVKNALITWQKQVMEDPATWRFAHQLNIWKSMDNVNAVMSSNEVK